MSAGKMSSAKMTIRVLSVLTYTLCMHYIVVLYSVVSCVPGSTSSPMQH